MNETGLRQELTNKRITDLFFCGLAIDYCVAASALDAIKAGFMTFIIDDACRGIDETEIAKRKQELIDQGGFIVSSEQVLSYLRGASFHVEMKHNGVVETTPSRCLNITIFKTIAFRKAFF